MRASTSRSRRAARSTSAGVDTRVARVVDIKTPGSKEVERNRWQNLELLTPHDAVKIVICDRADYEWARDVVAKHCAAVPRVFLAELRGAAGRHARRLDSRGPFARALAGAAAQSALGQRAGALDDDAAPSCCSRAGSIRRRRSRSRERAATSATRSRSTTASGIARSSPPRGACRPRSAPRRIARCSVSLGEFGGSALTDKRIAVPEHGGAGIPVTYVPARNTVFLEPRRWRWPRWSTPTRSSSA